MRPIGTFLIGVLMLVILAACQQADQIAPESQQSEGNSSEEHESEGHNDTIITAKEIQSYPISLYDETEFDVDGDGDAEKVELYTNAEKLDNGEFAWDDGQNWLLVVKDGDQTYPLFDGWVQLGKLSFWLLESEGTPMIILLKTGTAEFTLQTFTFNEKEKGFIQKTQFNPTDVNFWYNSK
ncbi:hypothetical protein [Pseudoneobacillus sp. C159]